MYKVLPIASHICFHQKSTTLAYVLEITVTLFPFALTSFANPLLYHDVYFLSFDFFFSFTMFDLQCSILLYKICVCHWFNKEISNIGQTDGGNTMLNADAAVVIFTARPHSLLCRLQSVVLVMTILSVRLTSKYGNQVLLVTYTSYSFGLHKRNQIMMISY